MDPGNHDENYNEEQRPDMVNRYFLLINIYDVSF